MHGPVKRGPRIEVPNVRDDELAVRSLVATSLACLTAGLLLAYATADSGEETHASTAADHHELAPSASAGAEEPPAPPPPPEAVTPPDPPIAAVMPEPPSAAVMPEPPIAAVMPDQPIATPDAGPAIAATSIEPVSEPDPEPPPAAVDPAPSEVPPPSPTATKLRIKPGVVAYLRCDGLAQRRGPIPCPRDRALEIRMREIIETLPNCREAHAISRGSFEIRLEHIATGAVRDLMVKAPNETADRAVRACAGAALRKARTELKPTRMIVSMRFKAR
jgi:hypothetical protein